MPDLMNGEFKQVHEAIDIAFELCCGEPKPIRTPEELQEVHAKQEKIRAARELMADLAGGNSR